MHDTNACFIVEKHMAKYLRITLIRFKCLHQFKSNSKLWQVYLDEATPHVLNKLTISSHLMMNFSWQVAHHDADV